MKIALRKLLPPALSFSGGALAGWLYYRFIGCGGSCSITSSPVSSMLYLGAVGLLLWAAFSKGCESGCSI